MRRLACWIALALLAAGEAQARPLRVMSLDQCADQYVLALAPKADLALSPRADDPDSWLRTEAEGRRRIRPTLEAAVGFQPDVVVRYWGGEPRLLAALEARGVKVLTIADAADFVKVSGGLLIVYGFGTMIGPLLSAALMDARGPTGIFFAIAVPLAPSTRPSGEHRISARKSTGRGWPSWRINRHS